MLISPTLIGHFWLKIEKPPLTKVLFLPIVQRSKQGSYSDNKVLDAKVRLQGDLLDHVNGVNRWSLKFKVDNKQALFSSRRFALISPHVRINHGPTLFAETMKMAGFGYYFTTLHSGECDRQWRRMGGDVP